MDISLASWLVIAVALALANLPFLNESVFGFIPLPAAKAGGDTQGRAHAKHFVVRLLELFVLYFVVGGLAYLLESRIGNVFIQTWEFYAITACMFVVLAFPGFVLRYLRKRRS
ncbi:MAG TPA: DUF2818 family protein [Telluria sp.]